MEDKELIAGGCGRTPENILSDAGCVFICFVGIVLTVAFAAVFHASIRP